MPNNKAKIIQVSSDKVSIGMPDGTFFEIAAKELDFKPSVGDVVSVFINGDTKIVAKENKSSKTKVTILGYSEPFGVTPSVKIYRDGVYIGEVSQNGRLEYDIESDCDLEFKCLVRSARCHVKGGDFVLLSFDRITGRLNASVTDETNLQLFVNDNLKKDNKKLVIIFAIVAVCLVLAGLLGFCANNLDSSGGYGYDEGYNMGFTAGAGFCEPASAATVYSTINGAPVTASEKDDYRVFQENYLRGCQDGLNAANEQ